METTSGEALAIVPSRRLGYAEGAMRAVTLAVFLTLGSAALAQAHPHDNEVDPHVHDGSDNREEEVLSGSEGRDPRKAAGRDTRNETRRDGALWGRLKSYVLGGVLLLSLATRWLFRR